MLRKILSLVFNCDKTTTMETVGIKRSETDRRRVYTSEVRTDESRSSVSFTGNKIQIPDPWDDILM